MPKKDETMPAGFDAPGATSDPGRTGGQDAIQAPAGPAMGPDATQIRMMAVEQSSRLPHSDCQALLRSAVKIETYLRDGTVPE